MKLGIVFSVPPKNITIINIHQKTIHYHQHIKLNSLLKPCLQRYLSLIYCCNNLWVHSLVFIFDQLLHQCMHVCVAEGFVE